MRLPNRSTSLPSTATFEHKTDGTGVFEQGQKPIVVGHGEDNSGYGTDLPTNGPGNGTVQIYDMSLSFHRLVDDNAETSKGPNPQPGPTGPAHR